MNRRRFLELLTVAGVSMALDACKASKTKVPLPEKPSAPAESPLVYNKSGQEFCRKVILEGKVPEGSTVQLWVNAYSVYHVPAIEGINTLRYNGTGGTYCISVFKPSYRLFASTGYQLMEDSCNQPDFRVKF